MSFGERKLVGDKMEGAEKYHRQIDPQGHSSVAQLLRWIRPGSKVLEMGPATGIMTRFLSEDKGCDVTCVEVDPSAAEQAKQYCFRMIVGDLNRTEWAKEIEGEEFDYIIFADVLEHLLNPAASLQHTLAYLKPDGEVLISVPNIGYVGVIAELLAGRFDYRRDGLLDETHVHFFTRKSLVQLLNETGLIGAEWGRTTIAPEFSEFKLQTNQLGSVTRGVLSSVPDGDTYQFLVKSSRTGLAALPVVPHGRQYATSGLSAQVYFDTGHGFSEQDSIVVPLEDSKGRQTVQCATPSGVKVIRLDPVDNVTPVVLHSITVHSGDAVMYRWKGEDGALGMVAGILNAEEAHTADTSVLIPLSNDPAVTVIVNCPEEATLTVELSFDAPETLATAIRTIGPITAERDALAQARHSLVHERDSLVQERASLEKTVDSLRAGLESSLSQIQNFKAEVLAREESLRQSNAALEYLQQAKRLVEDTLNGVVQSNSWKLTRPLRVGVRFIGALKRLSKRFIKRSLGKVVRNSKRIAASRLGGYLWRRFAIGSEYELRMLRVEPSARELKRMRDESMRVKGPVFSVVMPTYKTAPLWLKEAIESVRQQAYPFWELCIADDASDDPAVRSVLSTYAANDERIKVRFLHENGHISKSSNAALDLATGEYVVLLDHDDLFVPHALYRLAQALKVNPATDVIYSDEDKISLDGTRGEPTCKPAWSPDYFLSFMYTGHISCFRTSLVREVGGFRLGFEGSQDYDLMLRVTERTNQVIHIPEVLYHWRVHQDSVAGNLDSKPYAFMAAKKALLEALQRRGFPNARVVDSRARGMYQVRRGEKARLVAVAAIGESQLPPRILGVDVAKHGLRNISTFMTNFRGNAGNEESVIGLVCGVSVSDELVERLLDYCSDKDIGVAAPIVVDSGNQVVAAGVSFVSGAIQPNFKGVLADQIGYRGRLVIPSNVSLVHPACVLFKAKLLNEIPSSVGTVGELVVALCCAARKQKLRCMIDPSERVFLKGDVPDFHVVGTKLNGLFKDFGVQGAVDPFLPAGLPRNESRSEMPAA